MNKTPLVTILMPCYNAMPYLTEALDSIVHQTYTNLEILCINDGSTDDTGKILDEYSQKDSRIKVIHNEANIKLIRSLNKGIELANGEYIARMDADDISELNRIEEQVKYLMCNPRVDIVSTGMWVITEQGKPITKAFPRQFCSQANFFSSFFFVPIHHAPLLAKSSVFKSNLFLEKERALHTEDFEIFSRLLRSGYNIVNIPKLFYHVRINSQSVSRKFTEIQDRNFVECERRHYNEYLKKDYPTELLHVLVNRIQITTGFAVFKSALKEYRSFKRAFIAEQNITDKVTINEINVVYNTHLFDICFQAIKRCNIKVKLYATIYLALNINMLFNASVRIYLRDKVKFI